MGKRRSDLDKYRAGKRKRHQDNDNELDHYQYSRRRVNGSISVLVITDAGNLGCRRRFNGYWLSD